MKTFRLVPPPSGPRLLRGWLARHQHPFSFTLHLVGIPMTLLAVPLLVALNAFFVAAEFSLVTVRWTRVEELVAQGKFGAQAVKQAVERLDDNAPGGALDARRAGGAPARLEERRSGAHHR